MLDKIPNIIAFIRRSWPVGDDVLKLLASKLTARQYPRRTCLVSEGLFAKKAWFIENGMTRSYWLVDGAEVTTSFTVGGCIVFSMDEMYYGIPSQEFVETIGDVEAYEIAISDLIELISINLPLCNWWRVNHQNEYRRIHRSHLERLSLDAADRYREFSLQFPEVCRNARLVDIASYLGINPSTLSRIRRNF